MYHKVLIALFSLTFLNVAFVYSEIENCDFPCAEYDTKPLCILDIEEVCFRILPSKCVMDRMKCLFQKDYEIFIDTYCELEAFRCKDQLLYQSPPEKSTKVKAKDVA